MNSMPGDSGASPTKRRNNGSAARAIGREGRDAYSRYQPASDSPNQKQMPSESGQDLHAIFHASVEFLQNPPLPQPNDIRRTSSTSLYPSLESLSHPDNTLDVERNWEAAARSSLKKRAQQHNNHSSPTSCTRVTFSPSHDTRTFFPSNDTRTFSPTQHAAIATPASAARFPSPHSPLVARAAAPTRASSGEDDDLIAQKLAAYGGGTHTVASRTTPTSDDDLTAMKLAAYEGRTNQSNGNTAGRRPYQQAQATIVDYDIHPSDLSVDAVQAEFVTLESQAVNADCNTTPSVSISVEATEATALDCYPLQNESSSEMWVAAPAAEATVLAEDEVDQEELDLDCKPPARNPTQQYTNDPPPDQPADATIIAYDLHPSDLSVDAAQAELIGEDCHAIALVDTEDTEAVTETPQSEETLFSDVVQAYGEGTTDDNVPNVAVIESGPMEKATAEAWSAAPSSEAQVLEDTTTVVTATFDYKPADGEPSDGWRSNEHDERRFSMGNGEAEVVEITETSHPAEYVDNDASAQAVLVGSDFNTAVAVPSTYQDQDGQGDTCVEQAEVVVDDGEELYTSSNVDQNSIAPPQEAHATLVASTDAEDNSYHRSSVNIPQVTAVVEPLPASGRSISEPPPTPVTVLEEFTVESPRATSPGDIVKPQPYSGRTVSAPAMTGSGSVMESENRSRLRSSGGSSDSLSNNLPPPIATATELDSPIPPPIPSPAPVATTISTTSRSSRNSSCNSASHSDFAVAGLNVLSSNIARGANNVMETLFGNTRPGSRRQNLAGFDLNKMSGSVLPRTLLPSSVIYSEATNSWVATVNTNQKALEANNVEESSKALRAFSVPTKKQAMALARAWAPPQMHPFGANPNCFICESQFAVFRRACHCRNCGVCVCNACSVQWPSKMLPVTYNIKKEAAVNICQACDWLCSAFRLALLHGDHDQAVALHSTGNINLTTPFANVKGELFYPVHCAVLGGNVKLLKWLVDEHCCPLRSIRISNGKQKDAAGSYTPILTSKGRSLLGIALGNRNIAIVRYLVVEKRMLLSAEKGLSVETLMQNLDLVLRVLPEEVLGEQALDPAGRYSIMGSSANSMTASDHASGYNASDVDMAAINVALGIDEPAEGLAENECIICFDNPIDCVMTPCGHQICCLQCGNHISRCPVCAVECTPMRVFKP